MQGYTGTLKGKDMYDLNEILIHSVECKASDIHLSVGRAPNYRIDGALHKNYRKVGRQTLRMRFLAWDDSV